MLATLIPKEEWTFDKGISCSADKEGEHQSHHEGAGVSYVAIVSRQMGDVSNKNSMKLRFIAQKLFKSRLETSLLQNKALNREKFKRTTLLIAFR
ncbi:MAG: hypothetical protein KJ630_18410 [Proteobacteria bacterium]|nr:hypothetical protein [Pseudomonadota bacterium]